MQSLGCLESDGYWVQFIIFDIIECIDLLVFVNVVVGVGFIIKNSISIRVSWNKEIKNEFFIRICYIVLENRCFYELLVEYYCLLKLLLCQKCIEYDLS